MGRTIRPGTVQPSRTHSSRWILQTMAYRHVAHG
jgi:hypothetical protein